MVLLGVLMDRASRSLTQVKPDLGQAWALGLNLWASLDSLVECPKPGLVLKSDTFEAKHKAFLFLNHNEGSNTCIPTHAQHPNQLSYKLGQFIEAFFSTKN